MKEKEDLAEILKETALTFRQRNKKNKLWYRFIEYKLEKKLNIF